MSLSSFHTGAILCFAFIASTTSLNLPINSTSLVANIVSSNTTTSLSDIGLLLSDSPELICNGHYFGYGLQSTPCLEAIQKLFTGTKRMSFGPRSRRAFDIQTPRRLSSSDGTCVVEISHKEGTVGDIASGDEVLRASLNILGSCVVNPNHEGGLVRGLGQFGSLLVGIRAYEPSVNCVGQASRVRSVGQDLLDKIPVTTTQQVFGPKGGPGVDVAVPFVTTRDNWVLPPFDWQAEVDTLDGGRVVGRWWDLWAGAVAVNAMCVEKRGRPGQALFQGGLRITLDQAKREVASNVTSLNKR